MPGRRERSRGAGRGKSIVKRNRTIREAERLLFYVRDRQNAQEKTENRVRKESEPKKSEKDFDPGIGKSGPAPNNIVEGNGGRPQYIGEKTER